MKRPHAATNSVRDAALRRGFDCTFVIPALSRSAAEIAPTYDNDQKYGAIVSIAARQPTSQIRSTTTDIDQVLSGFIRYLRENVWHSCISRRVRHLSSAGARRRAEDTQRSTVERARWTDERLDVRMSAIDTTFERGFEEMRAERQELRADIHQIDERLRQLDERLGRIGFWASGILATGLITLVATQL